MKPGNTAYLQNCVFSLSLWTIFPVYTYAGIKRCNQILQVAKLPVFTFRHGHNPNSRNAAAISPRTFASSASMPSISACTARMSISSSSSKVST